jgi:hypothetical protein
VEEAWRAEQQRQRATGWSPGQAILNDTGARQPEHTFRQPVPITARVVWADDGESTSTARTERSARFRLTSADGTLWRE